MREAALFFHAGVAALPLLTAALVLGAGVPLHHGAFAAALLGTLPLLSLAQLPLLDIREVPRIPAYRHSAAVLAGLGGVSLALGLTGPGAAALGLALPGDASTLLVLGALAAAVFAVGGAFHLVQRWTGWEENPFLHHLIPRTRRERRLFALLSLAAGFGEELAYRGYLLAVLTPHFTGPWAAALVSTLAFALLHAYQGPLGMVRSGVLGFIFAGSLVLGGSLWPAVVVHAGVDLVSGLILGPRMLATDERGNTPPSGGT
ncbi:MAG: CPBP family intramembrane glutamic endopeptidase [Longimicrobiales bacterium]|nr:CPBP family intramembrane glutamic endopeptidase [Longimicrobiales bacterium]